MNETDISKALGQRLQSLADVPYIVWPNKDAPEGLARPYLTVQMVRVSRRELSLSGTGGLIARGFMQVTIVADLDEFATEAETLADNIATHFRKGTKMTENGGKVTIMDAPNVLPGIRDGSDWRVPVQIDYFAS